VVFGNGIFSGCAFCKFQCHESGKNLPPPMYVAVLEKMTKETGVDVRPYKNLSSPRYSNFPYKKFLQNASDAAKEDFKQEF